MASQTTDIPIAQDRSALFDVLASTAVDGIIVIDERARILFYNEACAKLFQYAPNEVAGKNVKILMPEPYRGEHDGYIARYHKTHEAHIIGIGRQVTGRRKDGSVFPMYLSVGEGKIQKSKVFVGIVHDLTALRAEEERRQEADRHLAQIVESSDDVIVSKTLDGIVTTWNPAAERIFGYAAAEMIGQPLARIIPQNRLSEEDDILRRIRAGESIHHYETVRRRKDGQEITVSLSVSPVRDANGGIVGASKIARDVTEQRRAEAQTLKLESELAHVARVSAVGQLSSALAHELNQPLTAIMNYVSAAKLRWKPSGDPKDDRGLQLLDRAVEQAERAGAIIQRLRSFLEKREPQRATENINDLLQEAVALGFVGSHDDGMKFTLDLAHDLPAADVDRIQIEQVIVNLVRNAAEAMKSSPTRELSIASYAAGPKMVEIAVADTGPGMPDDIAAQLFEPFVTTKEKGMGVGLSICRTIVEAHGGRIWMTPNPAGGTIFRIQLPVKG
ncbi:MAG TPA: PAS domain S-box protein [Rhizomicrobium sp.]|nr:PAS domain S-box protein [Rhizomicrobium sp.]